MSALGPGTIRDPETATDSGTFPFATNTRSTRVVVFAAILRNTDLLETLNLALVPRQEGTSSLPEILSAGALPLGIPARPADLGFPSNSGQASTAGQAIPGIRPNANQP